MQSMKTNTRKPCDSRSSCLLVPLLALGSGLWCLCGIAPALGAERLPEKVLIDTDIGTDIDDLCGTIPGGGLAPQDAKRAHPIEQHAGSRRESPRVYLRRFCSHSCLKET